MSFLFRNYFSKTEETKKNLQQLEELTARIISKSSTPEEPIMKVLIQLSEHGVIGLNKEGTVLFHNLAASTYLKDKNFKGKKITEILGNDCSNVVEDFIHGNPDSHVTKIDLDASREDQIFDLLLYRVNNGEVKFILFLLNCLENLMFKGENCPMREDCPFNYKCKNIKQKNNIQKETVSSKSN